MTRRLVRCMSLPVFKIWGHALGRLLLERDPFACRVEEVLDALAGARGAVEVNGDPRRLELEPRWLRAATRAADPGRPLRRRPLRPATSPTCAGRSPPRGGAGCGGRGAEHAAGRGVPARVGCGRSRELTGSRRRAGRAAARKSLSPRPPASTLPCLPPPPGSPSRMPSFLVQLGRVLSAPRLWVALLMGFASGLPLLALGSTLQARLVDAGVDLAAVGAISLVGLPYTWKFLWSPTLDRYVPPVPRATARVARRDAGRGRARVRRARAPRPLPRAVVRRGRRARRRLLQRDAGHRGGRLPPRVAPRGGARARLVALRHRLPRRAARLRRRRPRPRRPDLLAHGLPARRPPPPPRTSSSRCSRGSRRSRSPRRARSATRSSSRSSTSSAATGRARRSSCSRSSSSTRWATRWPPT